jgi:hypothetical protein
MTSDVSQAIQTPRQSAVRRVTLMPGTEFSGSKSMFSPLAKPSNLKRKTQQCTNLTEKTLQELQITDEDEEVMFDALRQEPSFFEQPFTNSQRKILDQLQTCITQASQD